MSVLLKQSLAESQVGKRSECVSVPIRAESYVGRCEHALHARGQKAGTKKECGSRPAPIELHANFIIA